LNTDSNKKTKKNLFDENAASYSAEIEKAVSFSGLDSNFFIDSKVHLLQELIKHNLGKTERIKLLDVGCGKGIHHHGLTSSGLDVTGIDVASLPLEIAADNNPRVKYQAYDGQEIPFENDSFDVVVTINVLHHIPEQQSRIKHVSEMKRVTRKDGLIVIIEHNPFNPVTRLSVCRCPFDKDAILLSARNSRQLLNCASIQSKTDYFLFLPFSYRWVRYVERYIGWLAMGAQYCTYGIK